jgi:hypothetical protein
VDRFFSVIPGGCRKGICPQITPILADERPGDEGRRRVVLPVRIVVDLRNLRIDLGP